MKHNEDVTLNTDHSKYVPSDLFKNKAKLIQFKIGLVTYYAKLHLLQLEEKVTGSDNQIRGQFPVGQEIFPPNAVGGSGPYKFTELLPEQVSVPLDDNVVELTIGGVTYQVVTDTPVR